MNEKNLQAKKLALRYRAMADKILLGRYKEKYYMLAQSELDKMTEKDEEVDRLAKTLAESINSARAEIVLEKYDFACMSQHYAKNSEDYGSAAQHFEEADAAYKEISVDPDKLSDEMREKYELVKESDTRSKICLRKSQIAFQTARLRVLMGTIACIVLALIMAYGSKTSTYQIALGKAENLVGMHEKAAASFEKAYKRHANPGTKELLIEALYKAGIKASEKDNLDDVVKNLMKPAQADYKDAALLYTQTEIELLKQSNPGDKVTVAGMKWIVLDQADGAYLLLKNDAMGPRAFSDENQSDNDWENSAMREYLNGEFLSMVLIPSEISCVKEVLHTNPENSVYGTGGGADTSDRVFLLSEEEYYQYENLVNKCGHCHWLRTAGSTDASTMYVDNEMNLMTYGNCSTEQGMYFKPVFWFDTNVELP